MRISELRIHNFRSIQDLTLTCQPLVVLLGRNNHGKSNMVLTLEFALSTSAKLTPTDFFFFRSEGDNELWVELTFEDLTEQEKTTFHKYISPKHTLKIRKTATMKGADSGDIEVRYAGYVTEPETWWLRASAAERLTSREELEKESQSIPQLKELLQEKGKISKSRVEQFQSAYVESHRTELRFSEQLEEGPLLGVKNVGGGVLPDFYLMPAVRDLADETKVKSTTTFGRLLQRAVKEMVERDPRVAELRDQLQALVRQLNTPESGAGGRPTQLADLERSIAKELEQWKVKVAIEVVPPDLERIFELGTELHVDDGLKTLAERKGHGLQRALLFALIRAWASALRSPLPEGAGKKPRSTSESLVFAIEEPELFLHPHAQRRLSSAIREISESPHHQVFICTHSTHFVDLNYPKIIVVVSNDDPKVGTGVRQCKDELFAGDDAADRKHRFQVASWINPDRGELFFARKVILVEGDTEAAALPFLAEKLNCFDSDISVINCGSKGNLRLYITLLNSFRIPYLVLHDEDRLPDPISADWDEDKRREKRRLFDLNTEIQAAVDRSLGTVYVFSPDFEGAAGISRRAGEKKGKALAALDHFSAAGLEVPNVIERTVRAAYS